MAKIKGICRNEECELCDEIQEVEKSNFVCEKCGKPLMQFGGGPKPSVLKTRGKLFALIGGAVVVVAAVAGGIFAFSGNDTPKDTETDTTVVATDTTKTTTDTTAVKQENNTESVETQKETKPVTVEEPTQPVKQDPPANPNYGTVKVSYGKYTGYLQNGKPHGHGTVVFSSSYRFAEGISAEPGDKFEGDFRNGRISGMGYLYHDGNQTMVRP